MVRTIRSSRSIQTLGYIIRRQMSATFSETLQGKLARPTGGADAFTCRVDIQVPDLAGLGHAAGVSAKVTGGAVEWAYLGSKAAVADGSVVLFPPPAKPGDPPSIGYQFRFTSEGATY